MIWPKIASLFRSFFLSRWLWLSRRRGQLLRGILCWAIGCFVLNSDEVSSFDSRLHLRGNQAVSSEIVLITLRASDFYHLNRLKNQAIAPTEEMVEVTDSFYWNQSHWSEMLSILLKMQPRKIGVSLFFSESLSHDSSSKEEIALFRDPRIVWASNSSLTDRSSYPMWSNDLKTNIGTNELVRDEDGIIRRFSRSGSLVPHFAERVTDQWLSIQSNRFINYRGGKGLFPEFSMSDVLSGNLNEYDFKGKIILIGSEATSATQYLTPVGSSHRADILAQIIDNTIANRWITRLASPFYFLLLLAWMLVSVWILNHYPQNVAFFFLVALIVANSSLSALCFDIFYLWIPATSMMIQTAAIWTIFVGYHATRIEQKNWQLQNEQKYHLELEQLKNNFVSLISHDLKTPIAKIQAIADRLITQNAGSSLEKDLLSVRRSSDELNRYIQSILKVLRVESRDFKLNLEISDINETITEAITLLRPLAQEKSIEIQVNLEPLFSLEFDLTLLREVIINLVENAIKYTPAGGRVSVTSKESNNWVIVQVEDNGEGIGPADLKTVWGKFVRGRDQELKSKGTGLGLYLVKYFIELHGGQVEIESTVKQGTRVQFRLPIEDEV